MAKGVHLRHPEKPCPDEILLTDNPNDLAFWLQRYALSTRKKNGEKYPPKTVYLLLCGLQRHMKEAKDERISEKQREDACKTLAHGTPTAMSSSTSENLRLVPIPSSENLPSVSSLCPRSTNPVRNSSHYN